jgi:hypothetical protein
MISASELESLLEENEGLRLEVRRLRGKRPVDLCWPCEIKRRWLALVGGNCFAVGWALWFSQSGTAWMKDNLPTFSPDAVFWLILIFCRAALLLAFSSAGNSVSSSAARHGNTGRFTWRTRLIRKLAGNGGIDVKRKE